MNYTTNVHVDTLKTKTHFEFFFTNFVDLNLATNNVENLENFKHDGKKMNFGNEKFDKKN